MVILSLGPSAKNSIMFDKNKTTFDLQDTTFHHPEDLFERIKNSHKRTYQYKADNDIDLETAYWNESIDSHTQEK